MGAELTRVAVCGAGAMGSGIAQVAAQAGAQVTVFDASTQALVASQERVLGAIEGLVQRGKLTEANANTVRERLRWVSDLEALAGSELVIEAIVEDMAIKAKLFARLESTIAPDAILASNTSSLSIGRLAGGLVHPRRFVGMHFFNPATVMKLVEVIVGPATSLEVAARVQATAAAWGKAAIPVADVPGFIVNRVARPYYAEAFTALTEGAAAPEEIDALWRGAGFRMGPLELTDLIGQDVNFAVARSVFDSYFGRTRFVPQLRQAALVDSGWLGRKTGRGVYVYPDGPLQIVAVSAPTVLPEHQDAAGALSAEPGGSAVCAGVVVRVSRGLSARLERRAAGRPVIVLDWLGAADGAPVAFAVSDEATTSVAQGILAALGRTGVRIADRPGLIVSRGLAQIANAAADAVLERVADETEIDTALRLGANYPYGPFDWADRLGRATVVELLDGIAMETGEAMYRPSQYLRASA